MAASSVVDIEKLASLKKIIPYTTYNGLSQGNRWIPGTTLPNPPALL